MMGSENFPWNLIGWNYFSQLVWFLCKESRGPSGITPFRIIESFSVGLG